MSGAIRAITALAVVGTAIYAGFVHRSPWIVGLLTLSFTILYIAGKLPQWRMLARTEGPGGVLKAVAVTLPVQAVVAGLFYLLGLGLGALVARREIAGALETFDVTLAGGLLVFGIATSALIYTVEARAADAAPAHSAGMSDIIDETHELGRQVVTMPVEIFSLSRRLTDHPDRGEALAAMQHFFDHDNAFVRRVAYTALRFMGQAGRDLDPQVLDARVIKGMSDEAVWVRYDAAWIAGVIKGDDAAYAAALRQMIEDAVAAQANRADKSDAEHQALTRARDSLKLVEARLGG